MTGAAVPSRDEQQIAVIARKFRVAAVEAECNAEALVSWQIALSPHAMREIARRLDGGGVTSAMLREAEAGRARALVRRSEAALASLDHRARRLESHEASLTRGILWAVTLALAFDALADAMIAFSRAVVSW